MKRETAKSLHDAVTACAELAGFSVDVTLHQFLQDRGRQLIFERLLIVIGESVDNATKSQPSLLGTIPDAAKIIGMRHVLAHGYDEIKPEIVWDAAIYKVPSLHMSLIGLLDNG